MDNGVLNINFHSQNILKKLEAKKLAALSRTFKFNYFRNIVKSKIFGGF